jgi:peptidoglycan LD-endopeptidase CwlK
MIQKFETVKSKSDKRLVGLHPVVKQRAELLIYAAYNAGVPTVITQGFRSFEYQNQLYAQGRFGNPGPIVTNAKGGRSFHNYGLAIDFALLLPDGKSVSWDTVRDGDRDGQRDWFEVAAIGKKLGFEWGGDWERFIDMPHLQLTFGLTIDQCQRGIVPPDKPIAKPSVVKVSVEGTPVDAELIDGVTYVPIRVVGEALGADIGWDTKLRRASVNGKTIAQSVVRAGVSLVPLRHVCDELGAAVIWNTAERSVTVRRRNPLNYAK